MKLGAAYNFFDGEEILPYSIRSIRPYVDYICVVYQSVSNYGQQIPEKAMATMLHLKAKLLINEIIHYKPNLTLKEAAENEVRKRNIGIDACKRAKCTHYLCMDADELYFGDQFQAAKKVIEERKHEASFCTFINYFKKPTIQEVDNRPMIMGLKSKGVRTSIPFIFRLLPKSKHVLRGYNQAFDLIIDPTRMILPIHRYKRFTPNELLMQHMSWVRHNVRSKLKNSSCRANPNFDKQIDKAIKLYPTWEPGMNMPFAPREIKIVDNFFNIEL